MGASKSVDSYSLIYILLRFFLEKYTLIGYCIVCLVAFSVFRDKGPPLLKAAQGATCLNPSLNRYENLCSPRMIDEKEKT